MTTFAIENESGREEVILYQTESYISSNEPMFCFDMHQHLTVVNLAAHLENGYSVNFTEYKTLDLAQIPSETILTAFLKLCQEDVNLARSLMYIYFPIYYTWTKQKKNMGSMKAVTKMFKEMKSSHPMILGNLILYTIITEIIFICGNFTTLFVDQHHMRIAVAFKVEYIYNIPRSMWITRPLKS